MIRILVAVSLNARALDKLNEIPEFEVCMKADLTPERMLEEISQADALVCGGSPPVTATILEAAPGLKLIIPIGAAGCVDEAAASKKGIVVRPVAAEGRGEAEAAITVLKDFFNA
jgi:phosphoglycerate dehydrogenase-like enzyme